MVVNVCVSYLPKQKKKVWDCLQPYYLFFFVVERNRRLDTAGFDSIMVEVSFQLIGFSVSLVDLVMFGIPHCVRCICLIFEHLIMPCYSGAAQSMVTGSAISQDMAFPKSDHGEVRHSCLRSGFDKEVRTLSPCLPNSYLLRLHLQVGKHWFYLLGLAVLYCAFQYICSEIECLCDAHAS